MLPPSITLRSATESLPVPHWPFNLLSKMQAQKSAVKSAVVVPLYIYPLSAESWAPLYAAIETNPTLTFLVIVNPNSGPGLPEHPSPDASYSQQVPRLNAYRNVLTIGYIRVDYCRKPLQEALAEIARYASWSEHYETTGLGVRGIFVDETPNHYSREKEEYLRSITSFVKECPGILDEKLIAHNPGTPPDVRLAQPAEVTFVCEESYARFRSDEVQNWLAAHPVDRDRAGYMISGVPVDELPQLVRDLRTRAAWLFVTDVKENFYERFSDAWRDGTFIRALHGKNQC